MIHRYLTDKLRVALLLGCLAPAPIAVAEVVAEPRANGMAMFEPGEGDDPAYALYREGYHAILEERWGDARKSFADITKRFPKSQYRDDADYWTAFSWKHDDPAKARAAYEKIVREHPGSVYLGDAIADLRMLEIEAALAGVPYPPPSMQSMEHEIRIRLPKELQRIEHEIRFIARAQMNQQGGQVMVLREGDTLLAKAPRGPIRISIMQPDGWDPELQVRIDALDAMVDGKRDETTFTMLHDIALDARQPVPVRHVALNSLAGFPHKDPGSVFLAVADRDTNEAIQRVAIELFAGSNRSRSDRTERLMDMFRRFEKASPKRDGALSTTLYALAAIGDDRATDFIATVARSGKSPALRNDALYYLGNLGTDRARQALFKIVRGEK